MNRRQMLLACLFGGVLGAVPPPAKAGPPPPVSFYGVRIVSQKYDLDKFGRKLDSEVEYEVPASMSVDEFARSRHVLPPRWMLVRMVRMETTCVRKDRTTVVVYRSMGY